MGRMAICPLRGELTSAMGKNAWIIHGNLIGSRSPVWKCFPVISKISFLLTVYNAHNDSYVLQA